MLLHETQTHSAPLYLSCLVNDSDPYHLFQETPGYQSTICEQLFLHKQKTSLPAIWVGPYFSTTFWSNSDQLYLVWFPDSCFAGRPWFLPSANVCISVSTLKSLYKAEK